MPQEPESDITHPLTALIRGTKVGHYTIVRKIGSGGMGEVYLARDSELDRTVALKFLTQRLCESEESRSRLKQEARAAAKLSHPNIITIHDVGDFRGRSFFAMEYVEGESLRDYVSRSEPSIAEVLELAVQISDALSAAHSEGVTHRDIKPTNILIDSYAHPKIVDFGLATVTGDKGSIDKDVVVGTLDYMSPEHLRGGQVDARSDLFSFGVVLYEVLSGKLPFKGDSETETLHALAEVDPEPICSLKPGVPEKVQEMITRLLQKEPEHRYQHAAEVRDDLRSVLNTLQTGKIERRLRETDRRPSIAVLPFSNLSTDNEQRYFCEGMAEEIINALTKVRGLRVVARTSSFAFKNRDADIREIGKKLNVASVLEGSVRKAGSKLRISVQLIGVSDGYHIWSDRFDREMEDIFAIQDEIAANVVRRLSVLLSEDERRGLVRVPTSDVKAYDYYLRGQQYLHRRRRKSVWYARQMFERAIELDPDYALAYAGVSDSCSLLVHWYGDSSDANVQQADRASQKALELDPESAEAHAARGFALWLMNRHEDSDKEFGAAVRLNPALFEAPYYHARACYQRGQFSKAADLFEQACEIREDYEARYFAAQTYTAMGEAGKAKQAYGRALEAVRKHVELNPDDARAVTMGAVALCRLGEGKRGLEWAERALEIDPEDAGISYNAACLFALEDETDRAIDCLESAVRAGFANKEWVENDPDLNPLRKNPRFKAIKWRE